MLTLKVYPWTALLGQSAIFLFQKMFYNHQCTINLGIEWVEKDSPDASFKSQGKEDTFVGLGWRSLRIWTAFVALL